MRIIPKRRFSQNFMTHARDLELIADALGIREAETVLEIGPGGGALTEALLRKGAEVIAIEKDRDLTKVLRQKFPGEKLRVLEMDILSARLEDWTKNAVKVAGNIPYHITSPILQWLIDSRANVNLAVLTVQWEVAKRLTAAPGGKEWGALSAYIQFYTDVEMLHKIDKSHFRPAPKVDSAVIRITFLKNPRFALKNEAYFFKTLRRAFQKRRKTLLNSLADESEWTKPRLQQAFSILDLDARRRPETLTLSEWAVLSEYLCSRFKT